MAQAIGAIVNALLHDPYGKSRNAAFSLLSKVSYVFMAYTTHPSSPFSQKENKPIPFTGTVKEKVVALCRVYVLVLVAVW